MLDEITNGKIQMIINTPAGQTSIHDDSYIRKAAIKGKDFIYDNNGSGKKRLRAV